MSDCVVYINQSKEWWWGVKVDTQQNPSMFILQTKKVVKATLYNISKSAFFFCSSFFGKIGVAG